jgi:4-alpha-glucanotransferase
VNESPSRAIAAARTALGIDTLALAIHGGSFPMAPEEDPGRGSPYGDEAGRFLAFVRGLGFDAIQLGPQGQTSVGNPSPYDATLFSQDPALLAWAPLARGVELLDPALLARLLATRPPAQPGRSAHAHAHALATRLLGSVYERFRVRRDAARTGRLCGPERDATRALGEELDAFVRREAAWFESYAVYEALCAEHGADHPAGWPESAALDRRLPAPRPGEEAAAARRRAELLARHATLVERYALGQLLAQQQHASLREQAARLGLRLLGDLQIGASERDRWAWPGAFRSDYRLGAPPSRTNPEGQPWGYPVLDPDGYHGGAAGELFARRLQRAFARFDGLRIDHPHGLVDPWVYHADEIDALQAVQSGARLFSSPDVPDHPALARLAIATPADLHPEPRPKRWADDWVVRLSGHQVERYAVLLDRVVTAALAAGRRRDDVACEVLSTLPFPLARVLARHGLGCFRVTQKLVLDDPRDVYRPENAAPEDWIMAGTHDTAPIWRVAERWREAGLAPAHARRLAERLAPSDRERPSFAEALGRDPARLARAFLAELFTTRARHVMIFFADLFGLCEVYNAPGTISAENWTLRLPSSWRQDYRARLARGLALCLPDALATALRARGGADPSLLEALDREAGSQDRSR